MISTQKNYSQPHLVSLPVNHKRPSLTPGKYVKIGTILSQDDKAYSTVSGKILRYIQQKDTNNQIKNHIVIENDTLNKKDDYVNTLSLKDLIDRYFVPTTTQEQLNTLTNQKLLIDLIFFDEPFVTLDGKFLENFKDDLIETLETLYRLYAFSECVILVKEDQAELINQTVSFPLTVKSVKPEKGIDFSYTMINRTFNQALINQSSYNYLRTESIMKLHEMIRHHRPSVLGRLIIEGDAIQSPTLMIVRVGTLFLDLKRIVGGYTTKNGLTIHKNARVLNQVITHDDFSISHDLASLYIQEHREREVYECIACGRCNTKCPAGILPSKIMHAVEHDIYLDRMRTDLCIECGLCSFYCPSKINVMEFVKKGKALIGGKHDV